MKKALKGFKQFLLGPFLFESAKADHEEHARMEVHASKEICSAFKKANWCPGIGDVEFFHLCSNNGRSFEAIVSAPGIGLLPNVNCIQKSLMFHSDQLHVVDEGKLRIKDGKEENRISISEISGDPPGWIIDRISPHRKIQSPTATWLWFGAEYHDILQSPGCNGLYGLVQLSKNKNLKVTVVAEAKRVEDAALVEKEAQRIIGLLNEAGGRWRIGRQGLDVVLFGSIPETAWKLNLGLELFK